jgi:hypothetical protein
LELVDAEDSLSIDLRVPGTRKKLLLLTLGKQFIADQVRKTMPHN